MRIVAKTVELDLLSPHVFRLYIIWENGIAVHPDVAIVWRGVTPNNAEDWSAEEDELMRLLYPDKLQIEIMQALRGRAWNRIIERAQDLKLRRKLSTAVNFSGPHSVNVYHRTVSYGDLEAVARLVQTDEEKNRIWQITNELAKQTLRGKLTAYWWLPLNSVSFSSIDEVSGGDEEKLNVNVLAFGVPHLA